MTIIQLNARHLPHLGGFLISRPALAEIRSLDMPKAKAATPVTPQPPHATPPMAATAQGRPPRLHGPCGVRKQPFPGTWQQMPTEFQARAPYQRTLRSRLEARGEWWRSSRVAAFQSSLAAWHAPAHRTTHAGALDSSHQQARLTPRSACRATADVRIGAGVHGSSGRADGDLRDESRARNVIGDPLARTFSRYRR